VNISSVKTNDPGFGIKPANHAAGGQDEDAVKSGNTDKSGQGTAVEAAAEGKQPQGTRDIEAVSQEMNKFMELLNADIRFTIHKKTGKLMVQVVDVKKDKVLKELPPHEMLDTMAKIRDYVGFLLDKKA
jgi:flagellar protein FlaG